MSSFDSKREVSGIVCFFAAIALTLMYYVPALTGRAGAFVRSIGFGLIGDAAFIIPLFLFYAAIDFFVEKRKGVSYNRLRAVIILMIIVASLFAVSTMNFTYFKSLCMDSHMNIKANKAINMLWKSGIDNSLLKAPESSKFVLSGGLIGGGIATSLYTIAGKTLSILALVVFLLCQIVLIYHISLKKVVKESTHRVAKSINNMNRPQAKTKPYYTNFDKNSGDKINRPQNRPSSGTVNNVATKVNRPVDTRNQMINQAVNPNNAQVKRDPFVKKGMPLDAKSGFISTDDKAFGVVKGDSNIINYENKAVKVDNVQTSVNADFSGAKVQSTGYIEEYKKNVFPSFLKDIASPELTDKKTDFQEVAGFSEGETTITDEIDLLFPNNQVVEDNVSIIAIPEEPADGFGGVVISNYVEPSHVNINASTTSDVVNNHNYIEDDYVDDDLPIEIEDDDTDPYDFSPKEYDYRSVRKSPSNISLTHKDTDDEVVEDEQYKNYVPINAEENTEYKGFSKTEGRLIDTNEVIETVSITIDSPTTTKKETPRRFKKVYKPAPTSLLAPDSAKTNSNNDTELREKAAKLETTLNSFGVKAEVKNITHGPAITRFELTIPAGVKVSKVMTLQDDIQLAMASMSIRIEAPIPGKSAIGIEVPNDKTTAVHLRGLLGKEFMDSSPLTVALGRDIPGKPILCDLAKMPHLMIAGSTGSGKSVCINSILMSILCKSSPEEVRLIMIDPKVVELTVYNGIPHLLMPVVTDPKKAANTLNWAVNEMNRRYQLFAERAVRDFKGYNEAVTYDGEKALPLILIVVDELADLMTVAAKEVEAHIARLAAMARAAGIHMIIATQRPSVDVITGVIKSNIPSRIAFAVSSGVDSRTILDSVGAEKLLGKGDMLYAPLSAPKPIRGQGAFVSDKEVETIVNYLKNNFGSNYDEEIISIIDSATSASASGGGSSDSGSSVDSGDDSLFESAVDVVIEQGRASVSILQRRLGIGYPRAGKLIDELESRGIIGGFEGSKPRKVLITKTDWLEKKAKG